MFRNQLIQLAAIEDWLLGVTYERSTGFQCWLVDPSGNLLSDGQFHSTQLEARETGLAVINESLGQDCDQLS
jgi:hypothetical protein